MSWLNRENKIAILGLLVLSGFALSVFFHYTLGVYRALGYPYNTFLYTPSLHFSDFYDVLRDGHDLNPYMEFNSAQYPFLIVIGYLFSLVSGKRLEVIVYLCLISGVYLLLSWKFLRYKPWFQGLVIFIAITLLNYPFLIAIDRGNFEGLVFIFNLAFSYFFLNKRYVLAGTFLALAVSLKAYPAVLLLLFLSEKRYREFFISAAIAAGVTLTSLLLFKGGFLPNINFLLHFGNISANSLFSRFTSIADNMVQRGVSLLSFFKIVYYQTGWLPSFVVSNFSLDYLVLAIILAVPLCLYVIFIEKVLWRKTALLIFAMLLLPQISADYKLLHLLIPIYLLINSEENYRYDALVVVLFGLLLIPKDYYLLSNVVSDETPPLHSISVSMVINILIMLVLWTYFMTSGTIAWIKRRRKPEADIERPDEPDIKDRAALPVNEDQGCITNPMPGR